MCVSKPTQRWKFQASGRSRFQVTIVAVVYSTHTYLADESLVILGAQGIHMPEP